MKTSNRSLILPYSLPYFAYVLIALVPEDLISREINYLLRIIIVSVIFLWARKSYFSIKGPYSPLISALLGIGVGFIGLLIWIAFLYPFVENKDSQPWSDNAFILRLLSAGFLVPFLEELLMRGFIFRLALQWDIAKKQKNPLEVALDKMSVNSVPPGSWSWGAIIISTIAFASGHNAHEWLAAILFGGLMSWLWIMRKDLISCIVAHSVTNISLAVYVFITGRWYFW